MTNREKSCFCKVGFLFVVGVLSSHLLGSGQEPGFVTLFNGKNLDGWILVGEKGGGYLVKDGVLISAADETANLLTEKEYADFVFRFEFKLKEGGNNGVGIRVPREGVASTEGIEIQILDNNAAKQANIKPYQAHGSVYGLVPARRGAEKPLGEWNREEIVCIGRRMQVTLNDKVIVSANLNDVRGSEVLQAHPGFMRSSGHVGFLGHSNAVAFRNIRIKDLGEHQVDNLAPDGFEALFNGMDLTNWKGLVADPIKRSKMSSQELAAAQKEADAKMRAHWKVVDAMLQFDGKGASLCSLEDYGDFELWVDWKIEPKGDSGIYLRGSPQVQIWDDPEGSGALWNNKKNPAKPLLVADKPVGQWNQFRILMTGEKVTVFLNQRMVVNNVTLENYWDRPKPIFPTGSIELQSHGNTLYFKNVYVREISRQ